MIDTINGAKALAIIHSIAETAKANNLKLYEYSEHLLREIPKNMDEPNYGLLKDLVLWSSSIPEHIHKNK